MVKAQVFFNLELNIFFSAVHYLISYSIGGHCIYHNFYTVYNFYTVLICSFSLLIPLCIIIYLYCIKDLLCCPMKSISKPKYMQCYFFFLHAYNDVAHKAAVNHFYFEDRLRFYPDTKHNTAFKACNLIINGALG